MENKQRKLTDKEQKTAADILCTYIFTHNNKEYSDEFVKSVMKQYALLDDPFTHLPCTPKEYAESSLEYDRQTMIEKYGHCDGMEESRC